MVNTISFGAGGSPSSGRSVTGADKIFTPGMFTYPTGNLNLAGSRPVVQAGLSINGAISGGVTGTGVTTSGEVFINSNRSQTFFVGYIGNGFSQFTSPNVFTFSGGFQGTFSWYTVPTAPATITVARTGRNVLVTATASSSDGGESIDGYRAQFRSSVDGVTWSAWGNLQSLVSFQYTYENLTPALFYEFRVYAINAAGSSAARTSAAVFVPAGGKRWDGSAWVATSLAKRWDGSAWTDIQTAKRWSGSAWVDLS